MSWMLCLLHTICRQQLLLTYIYWNLAQQSACMYTLWICVDWCWLPFVEVFGGLSQGMSYGSRIICVPFTSHWIWLLTLFWRCKTVMFLEIIALKPDIRSFGFLDRARMEAETKPRLDLCPGDLPHLVTEFQHPCYVACVLGKLTWRLFFRVPA